MFSKKTFGLVLGLVALALAAVPAFASAIVFTDPAGPVANETEIRATSTDAVTKTAVGELDCEHVDVGGIYTAPAGGTLTVDMDGASEESTEGCVRRTPMGEEAVIVTPTFEDLHMTTGGTNTVTFSYVVHLPELKLTCNFGGSVAASAVEEGAALQAVGFIPGTSAEPCPAGGNFSGTFSLSDANGAITIDS